MKRVIDLLNKQPSEAFTNDELSKESERMKDIIARGLEKYKEDKMKGNTFVRLERSMFYSE